MATIDKTTILQKFDSQIEVFPDNLEERHVQVIANQLNIPLEAIVETIAQFLIYNFSQNSFFRSLPPSVGKRYGELGDLYNQVTKAIGEGEDIQAHPQIKDLLEKTTAYIPTSKLDFLKEISKRALLSHEVIRSFPRQYSHLNLSTLSYAADFFALIDSEVLENEKTKQPSGRWGEFSKNLADYSVFFFKCIALYEGPEKYHTWFQLSDLWAQSGSRECKRKFTNLKKKFPYHNILLSPFLSNPNEKSSHSMTFKEYTHLATFNALRHWMEIDLPKDTFKVEMENEEFRMDLVFYIGNPDLLNPPAFKCAPGSQLHLMAIRRFLKAKNGCALTDENLLVLWKWALFSRNVKDETLEKFDASAIVPEKLKANKNGIIKYILNMETDLKELFLERAFVIFIQN